LKSRNQLIRSPRAAARWRWAQANLLRLSASRLPELAFEIKIIKTTGDQL